MAKKVDDYTEKEPQHGKKPNQKLKPYIVLQYLLKRTDENHVAAAPDIVAYLEECGIHAERRSIYRDIEEINLIHLMQEEDCTIDDAAALLEGDEDDELKLVLYDKSKKGFYVRQRHFDLDDIRLLAECVYSAKFIAKKNADRLVDVVCEFVSEEQAKKIRHDALLTDRVKTDNTGVLNNISLINIAMSRELDGVAHAPEKISFKYVTHSIADVRQQIERRRGVRYIVSPYQLLINDGFYYLLAFDEKVQKLLTYRVDRMKDVRCVGQPRDGEDAYKETDVKNFTKRTFSMFEGKTQIVVLRFQARLLDAVIDHFGTEGVHYFKEDDDHFTLTVRVAISDQFFGWLLGFGKSVKLLSPTEAIDQLKEYMDKIRAMY